MEPMKLSRTDSSAHALNREAEGNAPEEGHQGDEGEYDGGDDEAPLVFVYEILKRLLLVLVEVRLGPIEVVRIDDCKFINLLLWILVSRCKLTIYDEPAKSGRCTCSEEREQGEEEHRKADGNAAAEVLGHRDLCFGIRVLVNLGLSRGRAREKR